MPVSVDQENLDVGRLGLTTIGELLGWAGRENRLVVRLLIDGEAPDMRRIEQARQIGLEGRHVYIETADPRVAAMETIAQAQQRLDMTEKLRDETAGLLRKNEWSEAMKKLGPCLAGWLETQQAAAAVAKMLKIDLATLDIGGGVVGELTAAFAEQLRRIQAALQAEDLVGLIDLLVYETGESSRRWGLALQRLKELVGRPNAVRLPA